MEIDSKGKLAGQNREMEEGKRGEKERKGEQNKEEGKNRTHKKQEIGIAGKG